MACSRTALLFFFYFTQLTTERKCTLNFMSTNVLFRSPESIYKQKYPFVYMQSGEFLHFILSVGVQSVTVQNQVKLNSFFRLTPWSSVLEELSHSAGQWLMKPKVHYCIHSSLPLDPILIQFNSVHTLTSYLFKIKFNIILPSTPISPTLYFSCRFSDSNFI
jgi:hypothetical protein